MYKYIVDHIPKGNKRPTTKLTLESITIHNTGNPTSTARNERNYLTNLYNTSSTSYHLVIDENEIIECIPLNEIAHHSGNTQGNKTSLGIEVCESGDQEKVWDNTVKFVAKKLFEFNWDVDRIVSHQRWNGKNCPRLILPRWNQFIGDIKKELNALKGLEVMDLGTPSKWAVGAWEWAKLNEITDGTRPKDTATREEIITMLYRAKEVE